MDKKVLLIDKGSVLLLVSPRRGIILYSPHNSLFIV